MGSFDHVQDLLDNAAATGAFPAGAIEVGTAGGAAWRHATGTLTWEPDAAAATVDTIFDLASLTKVIVTATLVMRAVDARRLSIDHLVGRWIREWRGADRTGVTIADLLSHASGLTAYLPFFRDSVGRTELEHGICAVPLEYAPRSRSLYSDLGFMLLGFILEDAGHPGVAGVGGADGPPPPRLDVQFREASGWLGPDPLVFTPPRAWRDRIAPTEVDPWRGRLLVGEVHDENAWALGGIAGHAGLFGTVGAVGAFARAVLRTLAGDLVLASPSTLRLFATPTNVPGSSRALGWDTMRPTSSCGSRISPTAIGHTGFTGTSLWIDWERDLYIVLLTNRVHPTRLNEQLMAIRPAIHDAVIEVATSSRGS